MPVGDDDAVVAACRHVIATCGIEGVLATRSEQGMTLVQGDAVHHLPARAREVFDVSGADINANRLDWFGRTQIVEPVLHALGNVVEMAAAHLGPVRPRTRHTMTADDVIDFLAVVVAMFLVNCAGHELGSEDRRRAAVMLADRQPEISD